MNGQAATASVEEFIRWANLPFSPREAKLLNNGATVHVDGAKYYGHAVHGRTSSTTGLRSG